MADEMFGSTDRDGGFVAADARPKPTEAVAWVQGNGAAENGEDGHHLNIFSNILPHVLTTNQQVIA